MLPIEGDTIVAIATPKGVGGIGIIRVSGSLVKTIIKQICKNVQLEPNKAIYTDFLNTDLSYSVSSYSVFKVSNFSLCSSNFNL